MRFGFLLPSNNTATEPEVYRLIPPGYSAHFQRLRLEGDSDRSYVGMLNELPSAAERLAEARVHFICFACTTGSLYNGLGFDSKVAQDIESITGVRATTTSTAVLSALRTLRVKSVSVVSPYEEWLNQRVRAFLEASGFNVLTIGSIKRYDNKGRKEPIGEIETERILDTALMSIHDSADAVFISCTALKATPVLQTVEERTGKFAISSNQASVWQLLKMSGVHAAISGYGTLTRDYLS